MSNWGRALRRKGEQAVSGRPAGKEPTMTQTTASATTTAATGTAGAFLTTRPVWLTGAAAAVAGALVLFGYGAVAAALSVPMKAGEPWAGHAQALNAGSFAIGTLICTFWGTVLAVVLARRAARPARAFARSAAALVAVSLAFPLTAAHTATATRLTLAGAHLLAAAIIIPVITRRLTHPR
jgi:hypothetical protein